MPANPAQIPRVADIDDETVARVLQWCADAGRRASPGQVRAALSALSWDALLAARALLADDPPTSPLGPFALADIARGTSPELAAERERTGAYAPAAAAAEGAASAAAEHASDAPAPERKKTRGRATRRVATVVIRRARDRRPDEAPLPPPHPVVDELFVSEGRSVVERWIRRHGARRARIAEELAAWIRPDGSPAGEDDLTRLLDAHGLTRGFERRERAEVLHALRAAGGRLGGAARSLGVSAEGFQALARRLRITPEVDAIREERRDEIRRRGTLGDRVRLLVDEAERIEDLGMTPEIEGDLRDRLREHARALRASHSRNVGAAFARTLGITREQAEGMAARFGLELREAPPSSRAGAPIRPRTGAAPPRSGRPPATDRSFASRGGGAARAGARGSARPAHPRGAAPRGGSRPPAPSRGGPPRSAPAAAGAPRGAPPRGAPSRAPRRGGPPRPDRSGPRRPPRR